MCFMQWLGTIFSTFTIIFLFYLYILYSIAFDCFNYQIVERYILTYQNIICHFYQIYYRFNGNPGWHSGKLSACNAGCLQCRHGFDPGIRILEKERETHSCILNGKSCEQRRWSQMCQIHLRIFLSMDYSLVMVKGLV